MIQNMETPKQLAERVGWPVRRIRSLIASKLLRRHRVGGSILIPTDAMEEFLKSTEVPPCHAVKQGRVSTPVETNAITSFVSSTPTDAKRKFQQAQKAVQRLKKSSKSS